MLKVQEIREIIKLIDESSINEFTYETNGTTIMMKKSNNSSVEQVEGHSQIVKEKIVLDNPPVAEKTIEEVNVAPAIKNEQTVEEASEDDYYQITSPMVGTFYQAPSPESGPYVKEGSKVDESSIVCIVEAMKLFNEIEAEVSGEIIEILVEDGELVEYGQPLFKVKTK